jgi:glycosyltransferase involved in cell wall biosynthesis
VIEKPPISFLMLTLNEEVNLQQSLPVIADFTDDIVVVDSFSSDRTIDIAKQFGARVFQNKFEGHARQWLWGFRNSSLRHEWVFMYDPDHRLTRELKTELQELFEHGVSQNVNGFYVKRRNVFQGKWIRHGGYYPVYMLKLVRADKVFFDEHEFDYRAYVPPKTGELKHDIIEENLKENDITFWIEKHNRFAVRQAEEELFRLQHPDSWKVQPNLFGTHDQQTLWLKIKWYRLPLFIRPFLYFIYRYFLRLGFLDGKEGFIFHFLQGFWYRLLVDIKLDQMGKDAASLPAVGDGESPSPKSL